MQIEYESFSWLNDKMNYSFPNKQNQKLSTKHEKETPLFSMISGASQKNCLYIFCFARAHFFLKGKGNFSASLSAEVSLLGFVYQIWQNNFKGL